MEVVDARGVAHARAHRCSAHRVRPCVSVEGGVGGADRRTRRRCVRRTRVQRALPRGPASAVRHDHGVHSLLLPVLQRDGGLRVVARKRLPHVLGLLRTRRAVRGRLEASARRVVRRGLLAAPLRVRVRATDAALPPAPRAVRPRQRRVPVPHERHAGAARQRGGHGVPDGARDARHERDGQRVHRRASLVHRRLRRRPRRHALLRPRIRARLQALGRPRRCWDDVGASRRLRARVRAQTGQGERGWIPARRRDARVPVHCSRASEHRQPRRDHAERWGGLCHAQRVLVRGRRSQRERLGLCLLGNGWRPAVVPRHRARAPG